MHFYVNKFARLGLMMLICGMINIQIMNEYTFAVALVICVTILIVKVINLIKNKLPGL